MQKIDNDAFYEYIKQYDSDSGYHIVGTVEFHLLCDDKSYEGINSHREALRFLFDWIVEKSIEDKENARIILGDDMADQLHPLVYDIDKAQPYPLNPQLFFYCPNIIKTDYYCNVWYDTEWKLNNKNCGTAVPYWYALMEPVYDRRNKPEDFKKINEALFPNGTNALDIYEWTTDWSNFFDAGHEWYGACCWSVYDKTLSRYVVMLVSATD